MLCYYNYIIIGLFYDSANAPIVGYSDNTDNIQHYRGK